jgi:hypothetical protein
MQKKIKNLVMILGVFNLFSLTTTAQENNIAAVKKISNAAPAQEIDWENFDQYLNPETQKEQTSFVTINNQNNMLFVDFKAVQQKMNDKLPLQRLYVWSSKKELVFYDDALATLPQDAIYEIDLRQLPADTYRIELFKAKDNIVEYQFAWK